MKSNLTQIEELLAESQSDYQRSQSKSVTIPSSKEETGNYHDLLPDTITRDLDKDLWTHQTGALRELSEGNNVSITTSTSSGKTLVYTLQIAKQYLEDNERTSLILYPTKALARDQKETLDEMLNGTLNLDINIGVYDGDATSQRKREIRKESDVIISNFPGLNAYLNHHAKWGRILSQCSLIVIDESHSYTGVTGIHAVWIIRRLQRLLEHYGSSPQYVLTSATIGNPEEHSENLINRPVSVIDTDGSPQGERRITLWDSSQSDLYSRKQASFLTAATAADGRQTLMFTSSRQGTEHSYNDALAWLDANDIENVNINAYHAGYTKQRRRDLEDGFRDGDSDALISTNALELGINIGTVSTTVLANYPGTRQSFWQQAGRSGRDSKNSDTILVCQERAVDQYIYENPEYLLDSDIEDAVVSQQNNKIFASHVLCAAEELPLTESDTQFFDEERLAAAIDMWKIKGKLSGSLDTAVTYTGEKSPQHEISIYASDAEQYSIYCNSGTISLDGIGKQRAVRDYHEDSIFYHDGQKYEVVSMNHDSNSITVSETDVAYHTQTASTTELTDAVSIKEKQLGPYILHNGLIELEIEYGTYNKIDEESGKLLEGDIATGTEPLTLRTEATWLEISPSRESDLLRNLESKSGNPAELYQGGVHAFQHAILNITPLELMMDQRDINGLCTIHHEDIDGTNIIWYDTIEGGLGFSQRIYTQFQSLLERAETRLTNCPCTDSEGCPACTMLSHCGENNEPLLKELAVDICADTINNGHILPGGGSGSDCSLTRNTLT